MAFDGIVIASLVKEFNDKLVGGRLNKIAQTEDDELLLTIKNNKDQHKLLISANASLPLIYLTDVNKSSPLTAYNFCMLLRKHVNNGRIISISQPGLERIIRFEIEHLDEMGDLCKKFLIVEIMGKHSNIIFTDEKNMIIDSIKHIPAHVSSVREVLPGREYFVPNTTGKHNTITVSENEFYDIIYTQPVSISKAIYSSFTGISPTSAAQICDDASLNGDIPANELDENSKLHLYHIFFNIVDDIKNGIFTPCIAYNEEDEPIEFAAIALSGLDCKLKTDEKSMSAIIKQFYDKKNTITRIRQRSTDLRQVINTTLERDYKKYALQLKQLDDTNKRDTYKLYGELLNTYGYNVEEGLAELEVLNYYTNEMITIPLQKELTIRENSVKYFDKYNKLKRTFEALSTLTLETKAEIDHLESLNNSLDIAVSYDDLVQIKQEMIESGYIHKKQQANKKEKITSHPFHYISSDGFHMYVGKNNLQNEELTFKVATGNDWWFHAKEIPGSHVIVKCENKELPDNTFEEAARLAAHYSKAKNQEKVDVDYIQKKHIKKPAGAKPGFVIYHTNYSMSIDNNEKKMGTLISI